MRKSNLEQLAQLLYTYQLGQSYSLIELFTDFALPAKIIIIGMPLNILKITENRISKNLEFLRIS